MTQLPPPPPRRSGSCRGSWRFSPSGTVLSPPGGPLVPAVPVGRRAVPVLAAASAALEVDRREVAPSQDPQGLAEAERQAVALTDEAWRGGERAGTALVPALPARLSGAWCKHWRAVGTDTDRPQHMQSPPSPTYRASSLFLIASRNSTSAAVYSSAASSQGRETIQGSGAEPGARSPGRRVCAGGLGEATNFPSPKPPQSQTSPVPNLPRNASRQ